MAIRIWLTKACLVSVAFAGVAQAANVTILGGRLPAANEKAFLLAAMASGREKVNSGECFLSGRMNRKNWASRGEVKIHLIFDFSRDFARYDEQIPVTISDQPTIPQSARSILVRRPDMIMEWAAYP